MRTILKNYKTSFQAVLILLTVGLMLCGLISIEQMGAAIGVFTAAGLLASKDHDTRS